nr:ribosomal protein S13 [Prionium serratum]
MIYISGALLLPSDQVRIALRKMVRALAIPLCSRLGISGQMKMFELTKYQIEQLEKVLSQDHLVSLGIEEGRRSGHQPINFHFLLSWNSSSRWIAL